MIAAARALALGTLDLLRPRIAGVVLTGVALTLALFVALQAAIFWALRVYGPDGVTLPWVGRVPLGDALSWGSLALFPLMGLFLAAPVAAAFCGLFADRVAETVESAHGYPAGRGVDFLDGLLDSLVVLGAVAIVTLGAFVLSAVVGPLAPLVFFAANGWLLGREFFHSTARRHLPALEATALRRSHAGTVWLLGVAIAMLLTVPVVNIVVPVLSAAAYAHLFQQLSRRGRTREYPRA